MAKYIIEFNLFKHFSKIFVFAALLSSFGVMPTTAQVASIEIDNQSDDWSFVLWEVGSDDFMLSTEIAEAPLQIETTPAIVAQAPVQVEIVPASNTQTPSTQTPQTPQTPSIQPDNSPATVSQSTTEPVAFRSTRGGLSYIGIGGNFGITGDSDLGGRSLAIFSKIGLSSTFSVRPSVLFLSNFATFLIPVTYDLNPFSIGTDFSLSPYFGGGLAVKTGSDNTFGPLFTAGVDLPLSRSFTVNVAANLSFLRRTDLGLMVGIAYNF
jgi:hypothetical protein